MLSDHTESCDKEIGQSSQRMVNMVLFFTRESTLSLHRFKLSDTRIAYAYNVLPTILQAVEAKIRNYYSLYVKIETYMNNL